VEKKRKEKKATAKAKLQQLPTQKGVNPKPSSF
jgi:hypothetical protein